MSRVPCKEKLCPEKEIHTEDSKSYRIYRKIEVGATALASMLCLLLMSFLEKPSFLALCFVCVCLAFFTVIRFIQL